MSNTIKMKCQMHSFFIGSSFEQCNIAIRKIALHCCDEYFMRQNDNITRETCNIYGFTALLKVYPKCGIFDSSRTAAHETGKYSETFHSSCQKRSYFILIYHLLLTWYYQLIGSNSPPKNFWMQIWKFLGSLPHTLDPQLSFNFCFTKNGVPVLSSGCTTVTASDKVKSNFTFEISKFNYSQKQFKILRALQP